MQSQIADIVSDFEAAHVRFRQLATVTPESKWSTRRDPTRWSVAECVAHLNLTSRAYVPRLREAFAGQRALNPPPRRYRRDPAGWLIGLLVSPMPRIGRFRFGRMKTEAAFVPRGDLPRADLVSEFDALQDALIALTRAADGLPLEQIRIVSPFNARINYNAYACLWLLPRHQHRHLEQAENVWREA